MRAALTGWEQIRMEKTEAVRKASTPEYERAFVQGVVYFEFLKALATF